MTTTKTRTRAKQETLVTDERIEAFLAKLKKLGKKQADIRQLCLGERNFLKSSKYIPRGADPKDAGAAQTLGLAYRHKIITRYRNAIRQRFGDDHLALTYMTMGEDDQIARNFSTRENVVARHVDRRPLDLGEHMHAAAWLLRTLVEGGDVKPLQVAAALCALTGRRPIEILKTGTFELGDDEGTKALFDGSVRKAHRWALHFYGQAKTKGAESAVKDYHIPLLAPPELIGAALHWLRTRYDVSALTNEQITDRTSKELNRYSRALFLDANKASLNPRELRAAYATCAYELYAPQDTSWNAYTALILGHSQFDLVTSFSYDRFYPQGSKRDYERATKAAAKETLAALTRRRVTVLQTGNDRDLQHLDEKIADVATRLEVQ